MPPWLSLAGVLFWIGNLCLLAVFALAAIAKLRDTGRAREGLLGFGVPERWARRALIVLVVAELLIAALLAYPPTHLLGAFGALGALALFTLALAWQLLRGRRPACACFGALTPAAISWKSVGRNLALMALAGGLIAIPKDNAAPAPLGAVPLPALAVGAWVGLVTAWLLLLTRQNGRLLLRIQQLQPADAEAHEPAAAAGPLRVGAVPALGLSDAGGRPFELRSFRGRPVQLLFLDAGCNHCRPLLARLREPQLHNATAALVVISDSPAPRHELPADVTVLVDPSWSAAARFGLRGTPAAASLDANGALAQLAVQGAPAVHAALDQLMTQEAHHGFAPV